MKTKNIQKELSDKQWDPAQEERPEARFSCLLSAVAAVESGYRLSFASGLPPKVSYLALSDRSLGAPRATMLIQREEESFIAHSAKNEETIRFGWLTTETGKVLSNAVAITWPMVASQRKAGGGGTRASQYLASMQDGAVLGTVLFELLDQFRDFEVIRVGSGRKTNTKEESTGDSKTAAEQSAEFFYTDAKADAVKGHHWVQKRFSKTGKQFVDC